jgi:hypothetical protein
MVSIAEQLINEGIEKGIEKGERNIVLRLLQRRFGPLPAEALARIERGGPSGCWPRRRSARCWKVRRS